MAAIDDALRLHQAGHRAAAERLYAQILAVTPDDPAALHYLGLLYYQSGNPSAALPLMERAVALGPNLPHFHGNLGNAYRAAGRRREAVACYQAALALSPRAPITRLNLGNTLWELGCLGAARQHFAELVTDVPHMPEAHLGLGNTLKDLGLVERGRRCARSIGLCSVPSEDVTLHSNRLYALNFHPDWSPDRIAEDHRAWGKRYADPLTAAAPPHVNQRDPERRLRVGYVSPHFCDHAINFFVEPILASHDRARIEVCRRTVT